MLDEEAVMRLNGFRGALLYVMAHRDNVEGFGQMQHQLCIHRMLHNGNSFFKKTAGLDAVNIRTSFWLVYGSW